MTDKKFWTQDLRLQTITNAIPKPLDHMWFWLNSPTNYIHTLIKPFSFIWYVTPLLKTGALALTCNLFVRVDDEKFKKNWGRLDQLQLLAAILARWRRLVASNKALNLLYQAMRAVCTGAPPRPSKWQVFYVHFFVVVSFAVALAAAGAIRSK